MTSNQNEREFNEKSNVHFLHIAQNGNKSNGNFEINYKLQIKNYEKFMKNIHFYLVLLLLIAGCSSQNKLANPNPANRVSNVNLLIQKIDTSNYYDYYYDYYNHRMLDAPPTTNWLRIDDVVPIIAEEMKLEGHEWIYTNKLFKVDSNQYIVLAAYSRKSNFGFLYVEGHYAISEKKHRQNLTIENNTLTGAEYISCEETPSGKPNFVKITKLPPNVFLLFENVYWYQYTGDAEIDKNLLSKECAIKILKQDIRKYLSTIKKIIDKEDKN